MSKLKTALLSTVVLGATCLSHPVFADQQGNAIVSKTNYDSVSKTFEVIAQQSSNGKTIKQVDAAVWSEENGQDDIKWYSTSDISNGQARVRFNLANHGNRAGNYITHVYTTYSDGSRLGVALENTKINPKMPQVSVKDGAIQMATDVYAPSNGIIYYAVWSEENGQDDIKWYPDTGTGITSADLKNHSGYGKYNIHTYLFQNGKMTGISGQDITINRQNISYQITPVDDKNYDVLITNVPNYMSSISVPTWSNVNGQDDIKWYTASKISENTYKVRVQLANHGFALGDYSVHIYGQNAITNSFEGLAVTTGFKVEQISGLVNPDISISDSNVAEGTFKVNVSEKAMSKRVTTLRVQVTSNSNSQKSKTYEAKTTTYGKISQVVDLKSINSQADTFSVSATVIYSDNSTANFALSNQSYKPQATPTPRITTYINETNTYPVGQCTWAVKSLAPWIPNWLGNAGGWATNAKAKGFRTGSTPRVGSIAVWPNDGGGYGHVAYVTDVASNTRIQVKESNYAGNQYIANFRGWFNPLDSFWGGSVTYIYPD